MFILNAVIVNCGDGSNAIEWSSDPRVLEIKTNLADSGDERYASGDGIQIYSLKFATETEFLNFISLNCPYLHTMENWGDEWL